MHFKQWLQKNEGLTEPPLERPDELLRKDAEEGRPQALPTYEMPPRKNMKKKMKKS